MGIIEVILISIGLAMDAFAVSICKGLSMKKMNWKKALIIGAYFGIFQALMPTLGYFLGTRFEHLVINIDHWIVFILLVFIGVNMIREALDTECKEESSNDTIKFKDMVILAIATSIDAFAVGITFAFLDTNIIFAFSSIGIITFLISVLGVKIGNRFGDKYENKAEFVGGLILILIGLKVLLEHLGILNFLNDKIFILK